MFSPGEVLATCDHGPNQREVSPCDDFWSDLGRPMSHGRGVKRTPTTLDGHMPARQSSSREWFPSSFA